MQLIIVIDANTNKGLRYVHYFIRQQVIPIVPAEILCN